MQFLIENSLYVTLIIATMILVGLLIYIARVDGSVRRLERMNDADLPSKL